MGESGIRSFFKEIKLEEYADIFVARGFDTEDDICFLDEDDLHLLQVTNEEHKELILKSAKNFEPSFEHSLLIWLKKHFLEHYFSNFIENDLITMEDVTKLKLDCETSLGVLEITAPGHIKRLKRAVNGLKKRQRLSHLEGETVAMGYWCRPSTLPDARTNFLCLKATLKSTQSDANITTEFMVDSGSDVITIRREVLEFLNLELIGTVESHGIHASKETQLYRAWLTVGTEQLHVEVMPDTYDSLGVQVMKHFSHIIYPDHHIWMKTETVGDPGPAAGQQDMDTQGTEVPQTGDECKIDPPSLPSTSTVDT